MRVSPHVSATSAQTLSHGKIPFSPHRNLEGDQSRSRSFLASSQGIKGLPAFSAMASPRSRRYLISVPCGALAGYIYQVVSFRQNDPVYFTPLALRIGRFSIWLDLSGTDQKRISMEQIEPTLQNETMAMLAEQFVLCPENSTAGSEVLATESLDFSIQSLNAVDDYGSHA